ncbi:hypothetical protein HYH02_012135 [Chlamydomonas schloesseri]|uniref:MYND-type domain-containing protein n=1 Tax=Chlamydomonas schloesseri TaxID=2026947 RepID=A0A835W2K1_9CHLO|nr:hypothetical protein HYH02_012135 [Chlamydomonas schloesseri]|eukprot:KAG2434938.1 hypothetical protein HYH02_012135 [Chlamydomonas schloesseri]
MPTTDCALRKLGRFPGVCGLLDLLAAAAQPARGPGRAVSDVAALCPPYARSPIVLNDCRLEGLDATSGGGEGEGAQEVGFRRAAAELYSTAVLAAAVLAQECTTAAAVAQQGKSTGSAAAAGTQPPPSQYRVPLPVDSIAQLFGPDGPCPNPDWQAAVRQAFASASAATAAQDGHDQQQQACMTHARAAAQQQQPQAQQMQTAAALMVPPGHVRSELRRRYPDRRLWLCDNPACVPAPELDASGWPLPPESCAGAGSWAWCGGCACSLYCSDVCRLAHWGAAGHGAVCSHCRAAAAAAGK